MLEPTISNSFWDLSIILVKKNEFFANASIQSWGSLFHPDYILSLESIKSMLNFVSSSIERSFAYALTLVVDLFADW